jgi:hypothetical protein
MVRFILSAMAIGRMIIGLAPFVAFSAGARLLGFPTQHDSPTTRLTSRLFGVRDVGLGVLVFYGLRVPTILPFVIVFNAVTDLADLVAITIPLVRREGIDRAAGRSAAFAITGGLGWVGMYWLQSSR